MNVQVSRTFNYRRPPPTPSMPHYLTRGKDTRPKCVLVLGDGFSRGFLFEHGFSEDVRQGIDDQIPCRNSVRYFPSEDDSFTAGLLWDEKKWPKIFAAWAECDASSRDFYAKLAKPHINPLREDGVWGFSTDTLGFELRCYLWHFFKSQTLTLRELLATRRVASSWPWYPFLQMLLGEFKVSVASFNYDFIFETALDALDKNLRGDSPPVVTPRHVVEPIGYGVEELPANTVLMFKQHGSLFHQLDLGSFAHRSPNPWLGRYRAEANRTSSIRTIWSEVNRFPSIPDLVPPGHAGDDLCNPDSRVQEFARAELSSADLVIFCGLSAAEPDTNEVRNLVESIRQDAKTYQLGLAADASNDLSSLIRSRRLDCFQFIDVAAEFDDFSDRVVREFGLTDWAW